MSMWDGYAEGLALGKWLTDKEFSKEAELVRHRMKYAKEDADLQHPLHIGMIRSTNALIEEIQAIANGTMKPSERVLSNTKDTVPLKAHLRAASKQATTDLSGGKQKLAISGTPHHTHRLKIEIDGSVKVLPIDADVPRWLREDRDS